MSPLIRGLATATVALVLAVPPAYADDAGAPSGEPASTAGADTRTAVTAEQIPQTAAATPSADDGEPSSEPGTAAETEAPTPTVAPRAERTGQAGETSAPSATRTAPVAAAASACATTPTLSLSRSAVALGGTLRLIGTGWCYPKGDGTAGGSRIGVKIDEGATKRVDGILAGANGPDASIWAIVSAADDGRLNAEITLPDGSTSTSTPALGEGSHSFRLLTGSLLNGDLGRSVKSPSFITLPPGTPSDDPLLWGHELSAADGALAWIQRDLTTADGRLHLAGTGWRTSDGAPSTVAIKLNASDSTQYERSSDVLLGDKTIWALLKGAPAATHEYPVSADGSFDVDLDLPPGLDPGTYFTVRIASGKFGAHDVQRNLVSPQLSIDGATYVAPEDGADITCRPTTATTTVSVTTPTVPLGGAVKVSGTGWCNPAGGGSRIGVKIDDGAISHLDSSVHSNRTIWAIIQADHATGAFTATIALPDGSTRTSAPALTNGAHTLRFLSGSLRAGDTIRSLDADLVVGTYRPNGSPDPVAGSALTKAARHGLTATRTSTGRLRVTLPASPAGTWVFLSAYVGDGSPRYPWSDRWVRLDARHGATLRIPVSAPTGRLRLVAQSGEQGEVGRLLGWAAVTLRPVVARAVAAVAPVVALPAAAPAVPARPVPAYGALTRLSQHAVTVALAGTVATVTFPEAAPGDLLFLTVYSPGRVIPGGWVTLDAKRRARVDLRALGTGDLRVVGQGAGGELAGWAQVALGEPADAAGASAVEESGDRPETARVTAGSTHIRPAEDAPFISAMDGWLLAAGAVVLAGTGLALRTIPTRKAGA